MFEYGEKFLEKPLFEKKHKKKSPIHTAPIELT
jgi:hypothetical protein